jgi:peptidoglycan hydrolase-like protein with peptidoglycan-binding domain
MAIENNCAGIRQRAGRTAPSTRSAARRPLNRDPSTVHGANGYVGAACLVLTSLSATWAIGCGASDGSRTIPAASETESATLVLGAKGPAVRAVFERLQGIGYFPNEALAARYPAWRPVVPVAPASPDVFDANLEQAVRKFQINYGLSRNGTVDGPTRAALDGLTCGFPDTDPLLDPTDKFDIVGSMPNSFIPQNYTATPSWPLFSTIRWQDQSLSANETPAQKNMVVAAATTWNNSVNSYSFVLQQNSSSPNISVKWCSPGTTACPFNANIPCSCNTRPRGYTGVCGITCQTPPATSIQIYMDSSSSQGMVTHEFGHALGLNHSSKSATMNGPSPNSSLTNDDLTAIRGLYPPWHTLNGYARDVAASNGSPASVWAIGQQNYDADGNGLVFHYNFGTSQWEFPNGDANPNGRANRIAVDNSGRPWVVDIEGAIWRLNGDTWEQLPAPPGINCPSSGCGAIDIGVSTVGNNSPDAYVIGNDSPPGGGGGGVYQWNESLYVPGVSPNFGFQPWSGPVAGGTAVRVAVTYGQPYVVQNNNLIWRLVNGAWQQLSGGAIDIGANGGYVWALGTDSNSCGNTIWVLDEQGAGGGGPPAREFDFSGPNPATSLGANQPYWVPVQGCASAIAVGWAPGQGNEPGAPMPFAVAQGAVYMLQ